MNELIKRQSTIVRGVFSNIPVPKKLFAASLQLLENELVKLNGVILRHDDRTPLTNLFAPGLYVREIEIPAGYLLTTAIHATEHVAIISKGSCLVATENGVEHIEAPHTMITKIGTKRALLVLEDLVWTCVHAMDVSTVEEAEELAEFKSWEDCSWLI